MLLKAGSNRDVTKYSLSLSLESIAERARDVSHPWERNQESSRHARIRVDHAMAQNSLHQHSNLAV